jgi:hypothetical protein
MSDDFNKINLVNLTPLLIFLALVFTPIGIHLLVQHFKPKYTFIQTSYAVDGTVTLESVTTLHDGDKEYCSSTLKSQLISPDFIRMKLLSKHCSNDNTQDIKGEPNAHSAG